MAKAKTAKRPKVTCKCDLCREVIYTGEHEPWMPGGLEIVREGGGTVIQERDRPGCPSYHYAFCSEKCLQEWLSVEETTLDDYDVLARSETGAERESSWEVDDADPPGCQSLEDYVAGLREFEAQRRRELLAAGAVKDQISDQKKSVERATADLFNMIECSSDDDSQLVEELRDQYATVRRESERLDELKEKKKSHESEAEEILSKLLGSVISGPDGQGRIPWDEEEYADRKARR